MAPEAAEAGEGGLAGCQRVALDLHVEEELGHHPDERRPDEDEADLAGDVGIEDELARGEADAGGDDAGADDRGGVLRRRRQRAHLGPAEDMGRKEVGGRAAACPVVHGISPVRF